MLFVLGDSKNHQELECIENNEGSNIYKPRLAQWNPLHDTSDMTKLMGFFQS